MKSVATEPELDLGDLGKLPFQTNPVVWAKVDVERAHEERLVCHCVQTVELRRIAYAGVGFIQPVGTTPIDRTIETVGREKLGRFRVVASAAVCSAPLNAVDPDIPEWIVEE